MGDRNIKMKMGGMVPIKGVKASPHHHHQKKAQEYEVVQNALFIISSYPGHFHKMVLLSGKWAKRQNMEMEP